MKSVQNICVFCGASTKSDPDFYIFAKKVGDLILEKNCNLVYGGAKWGMMGELADRVLENGGHVTGIIPKFIQEFEGEVTQSKMELIVLETMHERKKMMVERSDAFLIMPGGYGTLDEFFEILTWKQLGLHQKPIVIFNPKAYWDYLILLLDQIVTQNFAPAESLRLYKVVTREEDIFEALNSQEKFDEPVAKLKWS